MISCLLLVTCCSSAESSESYSIFSPWRWLASFGAQKENSESREEENDEYLASEEAEFISTRHLTTATAKILDNLSTITMVTPLLCCLIVYVFINCVRRTWSIDKPSVHTPHSRGGRRTPKGSLFTDIFADGSYKDMTIPAKHMDSRGIQATGKFGLNLI